MKKARLTLSSVVEEVVFGVEDSLVSTLGTLTGIAIGTQSMFAVVLSGVVLIFAEAVSMMAGSYLSSKAESEVWLQHHAREWNELAKQISTRPLEAVLRRQNISGMDRSDVLEASCIQQQRLAKHILQHEHSQSPSGAKHPILAAGIMGGSYLSAGIIPLLSYFIWYVRAAIIPSIVITGVALFLFGAVKARITQTNPWRAGVEMFTVAMSAAAIGFALGWLVRYLFSIDITL